MDDPTTTDHCQIPGDATRWCHLIITPVEIAKSLRIKCRDPRHIPKVRVFDADFRKVKIKIVDRPVSEIPNHKFWGKI